MALVGCIDLITSNTISLPIQMCVQLSGGNTISLALTYLYNFEPLKPVFGNKNWENPKGICCISFHRPFHQAICTGLYLSRDLFAAPSGVCVEAEEDDWAEVIKWIWNAHWIRFTIITVGIWKEYQISGPWCAHGGWAAEVTEKRCIQRMLQSAAEF